MQPDNVTTLVPVRAFDSSPGIGKLAGALAKAQGAFDRIGRTREVTVSMKAGGSYKFAYAPLDEVMRAVRPALSANGLALVQMIADGQDGERTMTTTLLHESGEFISSATTLPGQADTAQEFGKQITYMRRYAIVSILGVVAEEDDDAAGAQGDDYQARDRQPPPRQPPPAPRQPDATLARALRLTQILTAAPPEGCGWAIPRCKNWLKKHFRVEASNHLSEDQVKAGESLANAFMAGGDVAYAAKLQELVATGRAFGGDEGRAA